MWHERRTKFHSLWDERIGADAAEMRFRCWRDGRAGTLSAVAMILTVVVGIAHPDALPNTLFAVLFSLFGSSMTFWVVLDGIHRRRSYDAASWHLGIDIGSNNFPPADPTRFHAWCQKHGVAPASTTNAEDRS